MIKKTILLFLFFLFFVTCLFSFTLSQERFVIRNNSKKKLIISYEFLCEYRYDYHGYPDTMFWLQKINGNLNVRITNYLGDKEVVLEPRSDYRQVVSYLPHPVNLNSWDEYDKILFSIRELSFGEKIRSIFKTFSIRTEDGIYIIKDIEDLCNNIIYNEEGFYRYLLEIYDE